MQGAERAGHMGIEPKSISPQELDARIRKEITQWAAVAKSANIKADE